jgi:hypothetical protein
VRGCWSRRDRRGHPGRGAAAAPLLVAALTVVGCSSSSAPAPVADPNILPTNYKNQIAEYLETVLTDRADFRSSLIAAPALKQVGDSQHYVACVQLNGRNQHKDKAVIYLAGSINQFIDATGDQCTGVAYEPFKELAKLTP